MPLTAYKLLKASTQSQLSQAVQLELSLPNRVLASNVFSRNAVLYQAIGVGTLDIPGSVTGYSVITAASDEAFVNLVNNQLVAFQPIGDPVVNNGQLYTAMGIVTPGAGSTGKPGRTPEIRIGLGYIQWKYTDEFEWKNLIELSALTGPSIQLQSNGEYIQWKPSNTPYWENMIRLNDLKGPASTINIGTVTTGAEGSQASATMSGTAPNQSLNLTIPRGNTGPANSLSIGTVATVSTTQDASATITGTAPNQLLNLKLPIGPQGQPPLITAGTATTLPAGSDPTVTITGAAPNFTVSFGIPAGAKGNTGPANSLTIGNVTTGAAGSNATATITGDAPNQVLNLGIPAGIKGDPGTVNSLSIGTVSTLSSGANATASVTGTAPNQTLNLGIPTGPAGTNSVTEIITGTVTTAGTAVPLTFTKTYSAPPAVIPIPQWSGAQMITGGASGITKTGCNFLAMQSRGTLLLTSGPFENAAANQTFRVLVIGN